jgi:acyl carrier protein
MTDPIADKEILDALTRIVRELTGDDSVMLTPVMKGRDIRGWDSATYVNFIVAAEIELKVKFPLAAIESFETFGDIVDGVKALRG